MSTKAVINDYFDRLARRGEWPALLSDAFHFSNCTSPGREVSGKGPFLEATRRFYGSIKSFEVRDLVVDGPKAAAFTRYQIGTPAGTTFQSDVAELFTVRNDKIEALAIYFDTSPFPK
jgi:ketosteroid isomerase-like protein